MYVCIYSYRSFIYLYACLYVCIYTCIQVIHVYICMYILIYTYIIMYIYVYIFISTCIHTYICIYLYICIIMFFHIYCGMKDLTPILASTFKTDLLQHTATYTISFISTIIVFLQDLAPNVTSILWSYWLQCTLQQRNTHFNTHFVYSGFGSKWYYYSLDRMAVWWWRPWDVIIWFIYLNTYASMQMYLICIYVHVYMYIYIYMYRYVYIYLHIHIYINIYTHIYIYTHTYSNAHTRIHTSDSMWVWRESTALNCQLLSRHTHTKYLSLKHTHTHTHLVVCVS